MPATEKLRDHRVLEVDLMGDTLVDRVYLPGQKNPIPLRPNSPELFLLARARDEAHRFSNRGRTKVGKRRRFGSELDAISGIGPKTRTSLLKTLGSLAAIRAATDAEILAVPGVTERHLRALRDAFAAVRSASDADVEGSANVRDEASTEVADATDVGDVAPLDS